MFEQDDDDDPPFIAVFRQQMEEATPDDLPCAPMTFEASLSTLSERLAMVPDVIAKHRDALARAGMPDQMVDVSTWNLYQTAFHLAVKDL